MFCGSCVGRCSSIRFGKSDGRHRLALGLGENAWHNLAQSRRAGRIMGLSRRFDASAAYGHRSVVRMHLFRSSWDEPETLSFEVIPVYTIT